METATLDLAILAGLHLETFLGGMETPPSRAGASRTSSLETFLGGMETEVPNSTLAWNIPLKPSLVEWKQIDRQGGTRHHPP